MNINYSLKRSKKRKKTISLQVGSNSDITVTRHQGKVAMIRVSAPPRGFSSPVDYRFSVRLDLDGNRRRYLPASQAWVRISTTDPGNYHEKKSSEVD